MEKDPGRVPVGVMMVVFGIVGLLLASGAHDDEMYVFGFSLAGFAFLFVFGLVKRHYDLRDHPPAKVRSDDHV